MGCGWDLLNKKTVKLYADTDGNNKVTLNELHTYAYPLIYKEGYSRPAVLSGK